MIALLQRVSGANVCVAGVSIAAIGAGVVVLIGVERGDTQAEAHLLADRVLGYRLFADSEGRMNLSLKEVGGHLLAVPQFTLAADTTSGLRASFSSAAGPEEAERLFDTFVARTRELQPRVATGRFGAEMQLSLVNDGPVTFWLQVAPKHRS